MTAPKPQPLTAAEVLAAFEERDRLRAELERVQTLSARSNEMLEHTIDVQNKELDTLRAELAGAQQAEAAAKRERDAFAADLYAEQAEHTAAIARAEKAERERDEALRTPEAEIDHRKSAVESTRRAELAHERDLRQIALSLDWGNVPPLDVLVKDIRARRDGLAHLQAEVRRLQAAEREAYERGRREGIEAAAQEVERRYAARKTRPEWSARMAGEIRALARPRDPDMKRREPGCQCHLEEGDSPCPVHDRVEVVKFEPPRGAGERLKLFEAGALMPSTVLVSATPPGSIDLDAHHPSEHVAGLMRAGDPDGTLHDRPYESSGRLLKATPIEAADAKPSCATCKGHKRLLSSVRPGGSVFVECPDCAKPWCGTCGGADVECADCEARR